MDMRKFLSPRQKKGPLRVGRTALLAVIDRQYAGQKTTCLRCGGRFNQRLVLLAMTIGTEVLGYFCNEEGAM